MEELATSENHQVAWQAIFAHLLPEVGPDASIAQKALENPQNDLVKALL